MIIPIPEINYPLWKRSAGGESLPELDCPICLPQIYREPATIALAKFRIGENKSRRHLLFSQSLA